MTMYLALLSILFLQVHHGFPEDHVAGLLEVPELFGDFPCDRYTPEPVDVYGGPSLDSPRAGTLAVLRGWYVDEAGPCTSIEVGFRSPDASATRPIQFMELGYEQPGLIVLEESRDWFRIRLGTESGWIRPGEPERFRSYTQLVRESLAYIRPGRASALRTSPGAGAGVEIPLQWEPHLAGDLNVEVVEDRIVDGALWFRLRLDPGAGCGTLPDDLPAIEGWIPAYASSGENSMWFHSRGC